MALTKKTVVDKTETIIIQNGDKHHYNIQVREDKQILEDGVRLSGAYNRYVLSPDSDVSKITDPVVLAQFNAVMTDEVKANYQAFKEAQEAESNPE